MSVSDLQHTVHLQYLLQQLRKEQPHRHCDCVTLIGVLDHLLQLLQVVHALVQTLLTTEVT